MTIYIVYKTTNQLNGRYYIGKHKTSNINDSYLGSGTAIKQAISKYGSANFTKEILGTFATEDEAFDYESTLVTESVTTDPLCYNLSTGGTGGRTHHPDTCKIMSEKAQGRTPWNKGIAMWDEEARKRISESNRARAPQSQETINKRAEALTGKKRTPEQIQRMSLASKNRNYTHSEEMKAYLSSLKKGKPTGRTEHPDRKSLCAEWKLVNDAVTVIVDDLKTWCKDNNISYGALTTARYKQRPHKGWTLLKQ